MSAGGNFVSAGENLCPRAEIYARGQKMTKPTQGSTLVSCLALYGTCVFNNVCTCI